jgi:putative transposase
MPQSLSCVLVHLVFSTKEREPLIRADVEPDLHAFLGGIARDCRCPALAVGGTADHIHILTSLSRTISLAQLAEDLKSRSSKWIKTKGGVFEVFHWQAGYGAFSLGKSQEEAVRAYIANQKEHHRRVTFQDEFRAFLKKYAVPYDERYIWD